MQNVFFNNEMCRLKEKLGNNIENRNVQREREGAGVLVLVLVLG